MAQPCQSCGALAPTCDKCNQTWLYRRAGWFKTKKTICCPTCCWRNWGSFGTDAATRAQAAEQLCNTCNSNHPTEIMAPEWSHDIRHDITQTPPRLCSSASLDQEASPNLCEVIFAKCIQGNESASLNHLCPIESIEILRIMYGTKAVQSMINKMEISEQEFLSVIQSKPPLLFHKLGFKKPIAAPSEIRTITESPIAWVRETGATPDCPDIRTRFGLEEGESLSRWCCSQARAKDLLHTQRSQPPDAAPEQLTIGTWNSGPPRSDVGSIEFYRSMSNHIIFAQEFDHGDSPLPTDSGPGPTGSSASSGQMVAQPSVRTLQECSLENCGFALAGACGGCLVGIRKTVFRSASKLWEDSRDGFMYGVIVRVEFSTKIAGHESLVLGSVHFHNDRIRKPVAGMDLVTNWCGAISRFKCDVFGFDANQGVSKLSSVMKGQIILLPRERDCVGLGLPEGSKLLNHEKWPRYICTFLPDISLSMSDRSTHYVTVCTFRSGKRRRRNEDTKKAAKQRQEAARKARKASGAAASTSNEDFFA